MIRSITLDRSSTIYHIPRSFLLHPERDESSNSILRKLHGSGSRPNRRRRSGEIQGRRIRDSHRRHVRKTQTRRFALRRNVAGTEVDPDAAALGRSLKTLVTNARSRDVVSKLQRGDS